MLAIYNGTLYHSMASNFGPVTSGSGSFTFNRFRTVSAWEDVGQVLDGGFGNVISASLVASRPQAISVFFVASAGGGIYRLWHAVRFSPGGSWRPPDDVLKLSGDAPGGTVYPWKVSAGSCPALGASDWTAQNTELLIALWGGGPNPDEVAVIRGLNTPMQFTPTVTGVYSPLTNLILPSGSDDAARNATVANIVVSARPFRDNALPPP